MPSASVRIVFPRLAPSSCSLAGRQIRLLTVQSFVLCEDVFKCHPDDKRRSESARQSRVAAAFCVPPASSMGQTGLCAAQDSRCDAVPFAPHTLSARCLVLSPPACLTLFHSTAPRLKAGGISIVMCLVASGWP